MRAFVFDIGQRLLSQNLRLCMAKNKILSKGERHDQINSFGCLRLCRHNLSTGNASCAGSRAGRHNYASRGRMRSGQDTSQWRLRGQNHQTPSPQVCAMEWNQLLEILLRGRATTARNSVMPCGPLFWNEAELRKPQNRREADFSARG